MDDEQRKAASHGNVDLILATEGLQLLEEVVALVIDEDEGGEVLNLNLPDGFHT